MRARLDSCACGAIRFVLCLGVALCCLLHASDAAAAVERIAVLVASNDGGPDRATLAYSESDAAAFGKLMREVGGLTPSNTIHVSRPTPRKIRQALERAAKRAESARASRDRVELFFYYSGHSDERGLLLGREDLSYRTLRTLLDAVPADVHIAILDSCASGAFTRIKGGKRRPPFLLGHTSEVRGHAFLTSSSARETAQESDRIGGSFFTHYLNTGLRGAADRDGDRLVTLGEAYQFAYEETLEHTQATSSGAQHATYDIRLSGSGELVMTDLRRATGRLAIDGGVRGRVWIRSHTGQLTAELVVVGAGEDVLLAVEPGEYVVTVENDGALRQATAEVGRRERVTLRDEQLSPVAREKTTGRGELLADDYVRVPVVIGIVPSLSLGRRARPTIVNLGLSLLWSQEARVHGVAMAPAVDIVAEELRGAQWTFGAGIVRGRMAGAQLTTGVNWVGGEMRGAQLSILGNGAGFARGVQMSNGFNWARDMRGLQLGLVNVGGEVRGAQVGLVNVARRSDASIGLFSVTRDGGVHPEVWTSDVTALGVSVRFDARHTYSILGVGLHPMGRGRGWMAGGGLGGRISLRGPASLAIDATGWVAMVDPSFRSRPSALAMGRFMFAWRLRPRLSVFGGPTVALQFDFSDQSGPRLGYGWTSLSQQLAGGDRIRLWPGFVIGVRF